MKRLMIIFIVLGVTLGPVGTAQAKRQTTRVESADAVGPSALTKLTASDGMVSDRFGISVAVSGDTALVGAPWEEAQRGAAYVFTRVGGHWREQAKLVASDGLASFKFGFAVALSGNTAVIGTSPYHSELTQGSAYVFERVGETWTEQAKLTASDGAAGNHFGSSVAVSGDTIVVGASGADVDGSKDQGTAYAFASSGGGWSERARLAAPDGAGGDSFGSSVAISFGRVVVGAPGDDIGPNADQGSAHVFTRAGEFWDHETTLFAPDGAAGDNFGFSVATSGGTAVVGAWKDDVGANRDQGSAYTFSRTGRTWVHQSHLVASDGEGGDEFGRSAAMSHDVVVLGSQRDTVGLNLQQGSAYVFTSNGAPWAERAKLISSDGGTGDLFGVSVAVSRGTAVIGAGFHNLHQGAAYVWEGRHDLRCG